MYSRPAATTDAQGEAVLENRDPGRHTLEITPKGYARHRQVFEVARGAAIDLGTIALERETRIQGRCLDADGKGVETRLSLASLLPDGSQERERGRAFSTDADGEFLFRGLRRGRYAIATYGDDEFSTPGRPFETSWVSGNVVVETFSGPVDDLEIRLIRPTQVSIQGPKQEWEALRFAVVDRNGLWLRRQRFYSATPKRLKLPPGPYVLEVTDAQGELLQRRPFSVGTEPVTLRVEP